MRGGKVEPEEGANLEQPGVSSRSCRSSVYWDLGGKLLSTHTSKKEGTLGRSLASSEESIVEIWAWWWLTDDRLHCPARTVAVAALAKSVIERRQYSSYSYAHQGDLSLKSSPS
jgi:hypothetical protein